MQLIYQKLDNIFFTGLVVNSQGPFIVTVWDENSYSFLRICLLNLLREYNGVLDILAAYKLNPFIDINLKYLSYINNGSDLNKLIDEYNTTLNDLEKNLNQIKTVMKLNGLMEDK